MTEEQMRHNALVYLTEGYDEYHREQLLNGEDTPHPVHEEPLLRYHVAGAHSRDKEVDDLEKALANVNELCHQQRNKIYELRHPWISVEKRLPKKIKDKGVSKHVFVKLSNGTHGEAYYCYEGYMSPRWEINGAGVTKPAYWMPIPEL